MSDEQHKDEALTPSQPQSLTRRSAALVRRGLAEALTLQSSEAYCNRGRAKYDKGDYHSALDDHTKAIEIDPRNASAYYNRGRAKVDKGDYDGAIADCTKAIRDRPAISTSFNARAKRLVAARGSPPVVGISASNQGHKLHL
jgi:tetratricopeptide (TPR) repeat protein